VAINRPLRPVRPLGNWSPYLDRNTATPDTTSKQQPGLRSLFPGQSMFQRQSGSTQRHQQHKTWSYACHFSIPFSSPSRPGSSRQFLAQPFRQRC